MCVKAVNLSLFVTMIIKEIMEKSHLQYKDFIVPLTVEYGIGNTWGESH